MALLPNQKPGSFFQSSEQITDSFSFSISESVNVSIISFGEIISNLVSIISKILICLSLISFLPMCLFLADVKGIKYFMPEIVINVPKWFIFIVVV